MFGLDPVTIGTALVLVSAQASCDLPKPTEINIVPRTREVVFDYAQGLASLQEQKTDTIDPYGFHGVTETQGFMEGSIKIDPQIRLGIKTFPHLSTGCVWYDSIDIAIEIEPKIVIAREVKADRCMHKAVLDHEMKHVYVDRKIVNKYARTMGRKVYDGLKSRGFISPLVHQGDIEHIKTRMTNVVSQIVEHEIKKMELERTEKQQGVDSLEEYNRVSALCPDFQEKRKDMPH